MNTTNPSVEPFASGDTTSPPGSGVHMPAENSLLSVEWQQKNGRRIELIRKKNRDGLSSDEWSEFQQLQKAFFAHLEELQPGPASAKDQLDALEKRLTGDGTSPSNS